MKRFKQKPLAICLAVVMLFMALGYVSQNDDVAEIPYSSTSNEANGTRALSLLMEHYGATVETGSRPNNTAIIFHDDLSEKENSELGLWVDKGGTLVVADPYSYIRDFRLGDIGLKEPPVSIAPACNSEFVKGVNSIQPNADQTYSVFEKESGLTECFNTEYGPVMLVENYGSGKIIYLSSPELFTNEMLDKADNSVLAYNLLQPAKEITVTFLNSEDLESGQNQSLIDLLPDRVWVMLVELAIAGVLLMLWRGRRVAKPVEEPQQVEIAASELAGAVGNLMQNARQVEGAAAILRKDLRTNAAELMGLPKDVEAELLITTVNERTGIAQQRLFDAMVDRRVGDSKELVELARMIEDVYQEIANVR